MPTRIYHRHYERKEEEFDTVEEAVTSGYWGDEGGHTYTERIVDDDGTVVFDHADWRGGILAFAEDEGYVNPDEDF